MQRRLCIALASVGAPAIMYLDEPTTGMDPLSRRRVWEMLLQAKQDCTMGLTTHSMEEADLLGDTVAILSEGHLRAFGDPLYLKSRFGRGYEITLGCPAAQIKAVQDHVAQQVPMAEMEVRGGTVLAVAVPQNMISRLPKLFAWLESPSGGAMVTEWGISNTTLEEVFLRLVAANTRLNANLDNMAAESFDTMPPSQQLLQA